ncbi:LysR family transcriptional regulator [Streptococcus chenjunshii]|uniref:LysR family transcriptional regulator n=1 Tax=Streptococcus chenjunshii TaxID=2173853 RepID=A0A372KN13_9STRE|nr:LysR family transcriptional regulator [Streptococcus chenjunshii]AXQ79767.1 LysR family transcriptional regulator [Streptococcus chenjunshii]RFU50787.1 LysR family transcriptional regulator [Streptococcus chenjunshii]RFU52968.1 LysR family transcriptional regulator [Streptococcus chenjunshii]
MNIQQLEYFVNLAQTEHMTKSATLLNTSQPSLSYSIHELEKELGVPLFEKKGRNIRLTKYGRLYYSYVQDALNQLHLGNDYLKNAIDPFKGKVDFGFIYTMGSLTAPKLTKEFSQHYPQVTFHFSQNNSRELLEELNRGDIDIALVSSIDGYPDLSFEAFTEEELVVIVPKQHSLAQQKNIKLEEIIQEKLVYYNQNSGLRHYLDQLFADFGLTVDPVVEVEEDHTILGFVAQNYGIAVIPNIPSISAYPVKKLQIASRFQPRRIFLATRRKGFISPTVAAFRDFCLKKAASSKSSKQAENP